MIKKKPIAIFALVGILVIIAAYSLRTPSGPIHDGKPINIWLAQLNSSAFSELEKRHQAEKAFEAMGPKAAPFILTHLRKANSAWARNYRHFFIKLPRRVQRVLPAAREEFKSDIGSIALFAIGPSVTPIMIEGLRDHNSAVRSACASTLGSLALYRGTDIKTSVPALTECLEDGDPAVRFNSALALGYLKTDAADAVSRLIPLLKDPQNKIFVRSVAARTLGKIGPHANAALPALRSTMKDTVPYDRNMAAIAIWRISADVTNTLPVLVDAFSQVSDASKWELLETFGEMGPQAKQAVLALLEQLAIPATTDPQRWYILTSITNVLLKIDADAGTGGSEAGNGRQSRL